MKAVIQRVKSASVTIDGVKVSEIGVGLMVLLGVVRGDTEEQVRRAVAKTANMRIFPDENGVMNLNVMQAGGSVMVVSQFTLAANLRRGNRPSYIEAAGHELAIPLYEKFVAEMEKTVGRPVATGRFGADMQVALVNDGPVTIILDTDQL